MPEEIKESTENTAIDNLADGSLREQLGIEDEEPKEEAPKEEPKADDRIQGILDKQAKLEQELLESRQEQQFLRGYISRQPEQQAAPKEEPARELQLDYEKITKDIDARGSEALVDVIRQVIKHEREGIDKDLNARVNATLGQRDQLSQRRTAFSNELNQCMTEFADAWKNDDFKHEADQEALKILSMRGGQRMDDFQPGDLYSAASRVYAKWERAGKFAGEARGEPVQNGNNRNGSSIREIARRVPKSDDFGTTNQRAKTSPKTIDDLDMADREKAAAKNVFKRLRALNPGMTEQRWVDNYLAGQNENET